MLRDGDCREPGWMSSPVVEPDARVEERSKEATEPPCDENPPLQREIGVSRETIDIPVVKRTLPMDVSFDTTAGRRVDECTVDPQPSMSLGTAELQCAKNLRCDRANEADIVNRTSEAVDGTEPANRIDDVPLKLPGEPADAIYTPDYMRGGRVRRAGDGQLTDASRNGPPASSKAGERRRRVARRRDGRVQLSPAAASRPTPPGGQRRTHGPRRQRRSVRRRQSVKLHRSTAEPPPAANRDSEVDRERTGHTFHRVERRSTASLSSDRMPSFWGRQIGVSRKLPPGRTLTTVRDRLKPSVRIRRRFDGFVSMGLRTVKREEDGSGGTGPYQLLQSGRHPPFRRRRAVKHRRPSVVSRRTAGVSRKRPPDGTLTIVRDRLNKPSVRIRHRRMCEHMQASDRRRHLANV